MKIVSVIIVFLSATTVNAHELKPGIFAKHSGFVTYANAPAQTIERTQGVSLDANGALIFSESQIYSSSSPSGYTKPADNFIKSYLNDHTKHPEQCVNNEIDRAVVTLETCSVNGNKIPCCHVSWLQDGDYKQDNWYGDVPTGYILDIAKVVSTGAIISKWELVDYSW